MPDLDRTTYVEPATTRTLADWTPGLIKAARSMADAGHMELAADFCESAMGDDRVQAALKTRTLGFVGLPLEFEAVRGTRRLVKALEAGEDWYKAFPSTALSQLLAWGILLGIGVAEIVWTDRGEPTNRLVPVLKVWHPRHLRYDWQRRAWTLKTVDGKTLDIAAGDGKWILYTPHGDHRPWAFGTWRAISLWHLLKRYAIEDWGYYSGKNAGGHLVADAIGDPKTLTKDARKELAADLFAAQANSAIVPPPGFTVKLVESTANTWQTFEAQKNAADIGMSVAILGQNLSTEVSGPVSTGATLHGRVLQVFIDADAETLSTCIHDQALVWWSEFNFGSRDLAPWPLWNTKPPEDAKARADVDKIKSATAKDLAAVGVFTVNEVRAAAGLDPLDEGGDELVKPPAPVAPAEPDAPAEDADAEPNEDAPPAKAFIRLASGRSVPVRSGVIQGQLYADAVADSARARAAKVLDEDVVAVLEAIEAGESFEDIRERLLVTFKGMSPANLTKLTEAALTMAELGGRHALNEDT